MTSIHRRLLVLVGLTIACGALALFVWRDHQHTRQKIETEKEAARLLTFKDASLVVRIELLENNSHLVLSRQVPNEQREVLPPWQVLEPVETPADQEAVDTMAKALVSLYRTKTLENATSDHGTEVTYLARLGLEPPRFSVTVTDKSGQTETLLFGKRSKFDGSLYVKRKDREDVSLVSGSQEYPIHKDLFAVRDKRLFPLGERTVVRLSVSHQGKLAYDIEKQKDRYVLLSPIQASADTTASAALFSSLETSNVRAVVSEQASPSEWQTYGLHHPQLAMEVMLSDNSHQKLFISDDMAEKEGFRKYLASMGLTHPIVELSSAWVVDKLMTSAEELRDKRLLVFERDAVTTLTLSQGTKRLSFQKEAGDIRTWRLLGAEEKVQASSVVSLIYRLANLKAKQVLRETLNPNELATWGLGEGALRIEWFSHDGTTLGVLILGSLDEHGDLYATTLTAQGTLSGLFVIDPNALDVSLEKEHFLENRKE